MKRHFREEADAAFHESVAREHLDGRMPVVELHRNHGVPLSAVRRWVASFKTGGRRALVAEAKKIEHANAKPLSAGQLARLRAALSSHDPQVLSDALAMIGVRRVVALANEVLAVQMGGRGNIEALRTLGDLGAVAHLQQAKKHLRDGLEGWFEGALATAKKRSSSAGTSGA